MSANGTTIDAFDDGLGGTMEGALEDISGSGPKDVLRDLNKDAQKRRI